MVQPKLEEWPRLGQLSKDERGHYRLQDALDHFKARDAVRRRRWTAWDLELEKLEDDREDRTWRAQGKMLNWLDEDQDCEYCLASRNE